MFFLKYHECTFTNRDNKR